MSALRKALIHEAIRAGLTREQVVMVGILAEERGEAAARAMLDFCKKRKEEVK